jgi:hypothetical protein
MPPVVHDVLNSSGQPMDSGTRAFFERRFGHDFGKVRVHDDLRAQQSAKSINSLAYTVGNNVVFSAGQSAIQTRNDLHLMAHELAHVMQNEKQNSILERSLSRADGDSEIEAEEAADRIAAGGLPGCISDVSKNVLIQRQEPDNTDR